MEIGRPNKKKMNRPRSFHNNYGEVALWQSMIVLNDITFEEIKTAPSSYNLQIYKKGEFVSSLILLYHSKFRFFFTSFILIRRLVFHALF